MLPRQPVFQAYMDERSFFLPEDFSQARSIIITASRSLLMKVMFQHQGETYQAYLPPEYCDDRITDEAVSHFLRKSLRMDEGYRMQICQIMFSKYLAVRSGLAKYGRNNLCYVNGFGSILKLRVFLSDMQCEDASLVPLSMLEDCADCRICQKACPTGSIQPDFFLLDAGKCLSLYNEVDGAIPDWISPTAHNAVMGCVLCQLYCPANRQLIRDVEVIEEIPQAIISGLLNGGIDEIELKNLRSLLHGFSPTRSRERLPLLIRNLACLLESRGER
jgi:epoxyqueuosine reductase